MKVGGLMDIFIWNVRLTCERFSPEVSFQKLFDFHKSVCFTCEYKCPNLEGTVMFLHMSGSKLKQVYSPHSDTNRRA